MDQVTVHARTTFGHPCSDCGRTTVATFEVDGEQERLCATCIEGYAATSILTFPQLIALFTDERITESELRLLDGNR